MRDGVPVQGMDSSQPQSRPPIRHRRGLWCAQLCLVLSAAFPLHILAEGLEHLSDLTDKAAQIVVTLKARDNFNSEYLYDVRVKNLSPNSLVGESLIIVLDKITNIGGDEWMVGTTDSNLTRMEILGQDGETGRGKPYFHIPRGFGPDLPPYAESSPAVVRIRNKDYLVVFTPWFRVYGVQRPLIIPRSNEWVSPLPSVKTADDVLIQLLIQKGVLSEEEGRALYHQ